MSLLSQDALKLRGVWEFRHFFLLINNFDEDLKLVGIEAATAC